MAEVKWTEESVQWLRDIYDYIASDNPAAAAKVVDSIYQKAQVLIDQPGIGYKYHSASGRDVRILLYGHYRITYLIKESGDIEILGIFHGALDIDRYLM
jgi:plasmid stabilization system protein ParE